MAHDTPLFFNRLSYVSEYWKLIEDTHAILVGVHVGRTNMSQLKQRNALASVMPLQEFTF